MELGCRGTILHFMAFHYMDGMETEIKFTDYYYTYRCCFLLHKCIAPYDYELANRLPLQQAREILAELKGQMMGELESHG